MILLQDIRITANTQNHPKKWLYDTFSAAKVREKRHEDKCPYRGPDGAANRLNKET